MFVTEDMADTAAIRLEPGSRTQPILKPLDAETTEALFFRSRPSRHNISAPDLRYFDFGR